MTNQLPFPGFVRGRLGVEKRDGEDSPSTIGGYGAVFYNSDDPGTEYWLWDDVVERIAPTAFNDALDDDVRSFFNHDPNLILGRNKAGTLDLSIDSVGLRYVVTPPDSAKWVTDSVARGDVDGSSFMFQPKQTTWTEEERDSRTIYVRTIDTVGLMETGPVVFPAYTSATADARSAIAQEPALMRYDAWLTNHTASARSEFDAWQLNRPEVRSDRLQRFEKRVQMLDRNLT